LTQTGQYPGPEWTAKAKKVAKRAKADNAEETMKQPVAKISITSIDHMA
jgi:hypothetical protein